PSHTLAGGETCATATAITSLPFFDDSTTAGASNDIDPGPGGCVPGPGPDVVYSFTPAATDTYALGATPVDVGFDLSLYVITDCSNPAGTCVIGSNGRVGAKTDGSEFFTVTLNAGAHYFIVVDGAIAGAQGAFHFSMRRGVPANEDCGSATVIDPSRLP